MAQATTMQQKRPRKITTRETVKLSIPPSARDAAFGGPPRYDWIDIETAAAVKIQSISRRNKVMRQLLEEGRTTAAIRNRARRLRARRKEKNTRTGSADIPNIFSCCGVGLAFGDSTEENFFSTRQFEKQEYDRQRKLREQREQRLRETFNGTLRTKCKYNTVQESFEIID